jgi:hypothetical protein
LFGSICRTTKQTCSKYYTCSDSFGQLIIFGTVKLNQSIYYIRLRLLSYCCYPPGENLTALSRTYARRYHTCANYCQSAYVYSYPKSKYLLMLYAFRREFQSKKSFRIFVAEGVYFVFIIITLTLM